MRAILAHSIFLSVCCLLPVCVYKRTIFYVNLNTEPKQCWAKRSDCEPCKYKIPSQQITFCLYVHDVIFLFFAAIERTTRSDIFSPFRYLLAVLVVFSFFIKNLFFPLSSSIIITYKSYVMPYIRNIFFSLISAILFLLFRFFFVEYNEYGEKIGMYKYILYK